MSALTVDLPADVLDAVRREARSDGDTAQDWIMTAVAWRLRSRQPNAAREGTARPDCRVCDQPAAPARRGLCDRCYNRYIRPPRTFTKPYAECAECHVWRQMNARGLCTSCYARWRRRRLRFCRGCKTYQQPEGLGLCQACYRRHRRQTRQATA